MTWFNQVDLLECLGCEEVTVRIRAQFSETLDEEIVVYYPPRISRKVPLWAGAGRLPDEIRRLLLEVYRALQSDSPTLALMGARAIVDLTMTITAGDHGNFGENLRNFENAGFLSGKNREVLESALDAGHAASHRGFEAPSEVVNTVMDIVENLLQSVFVLTKTAQHMKEQIPPRPRRELPPRKSI